MAGAVINKRQALRYYVSKDDTLWIAVIKLNLCRVEQNCPLDQPRVLVVLSVLNDLYMRIVVSCLSKCSLAIVEIDSVLHVGFIDDLIWQMNAQVDVYPLIERRKGERTIFLVDGVVDARTEHGAIICRNNRIDKVIVRRRKVDVVPY